MLNTKDDIKAWLDSMEIVKYTINDDLTVDVDGPVRLAHNNLVEIPVQFGVVSGYFNCMRNQLISLKGCPKIVIGDFNCCYNQLTSLVDCPERVLGDFICSINPIQDLQNFNTHISGKLIHYVPNNEEGIFELKHLYQPELKEYLSIRLQGKIVKNILDKKQLTEELSIELSSTQQRSKNKLKV